MSFRKVVFVVVELCLLWSVVLTGLAGLGNSWVLDRVAGGTYAGESMPAGMRVIYLLSALLSAAVMLIVLRIFSGGAGKFLRALGWVAVAVFALSTLANAMSSSGPERWNALPAALVALGTAYLLRTRV